MFQCEWNREKAIFQTLALVGHRKNLCVIVFVSPHLVQAGCVQFPLLAVLFILLSTFHVLVRIFVVYEILMAVHLIVFGIRSPFPWWEDGKDFRGCDL